MFSEDPEEEEVAVEEKEDGSSRFKDEDVLKLLVEFMECESSPRFIDEETLRESPHLVEEASELTESLHGSQCC